MRDAARLSLWATGTLAILVYTPSIPSAFTLPKLLMVAAGLTLCAILLAFDKNPPQGPVSLLPPLAAGFAALCLSAVFSIDPRISLVGRYNTWSHGIWSAGLYAALLWLASIAFAGQQRLNLAWLAVLGSILGLDAVAQRFNLDPYIHQDVLPRGFAVATLGSPVDLGGALALLAPITLWAALEWGIVGWATLAAVFGGLWACGARGAALGAVVGIIIFTFIARSNDFSWKRRLPIWAQRAVIVGLLATVLIAVFLVIKPRHGASPSDAARGEIWMTAIDVFKSHPLLGTGPDTFELDFRTWRTEGFLRALRSTTALQAYAHNDVCQALATTGLIGTAAYLWFIWVLFVQIRLALASSSRPRAAAAAALVAVIVNLMFNPLSLETLALAAIITGLMYASDTLDSKERAWRPGLAAIAILGLLSTAGIIRLRSADLTEKRALDLSAASQWDRAVEMHQKALALTPCELTYAIALVNGIGPAINAAKSVERRLQLLDLASKTGQNAVRCHPNDVNAHYIYGFGEFYHAELGLMDHLASAERAIDRALELDKNFVPLITYRIQLAKKRGDAAALASLRARLTRIAELTGDTTLRSY